MGLCLGSKVLEAVMRTKAPTTMAGTVGESQTSRGSGLQTYEQHVTEDQVIPWTGDNVEGYRDEMECWPSALRPLWGEEPEEFNVSTSLCAWRPGWSLALPTASRLQSECLYNVHDVILASACVPSCIIRSSLDEASFTKYNANPLCVSFRLWFMEDKNHMLTQYGCVFQNLFYSWLVKSMVTSSTDEVLMRPACTV